MKEVTKELLLKDEQEWSAEKEGHRASQREPSGSKWGSAAGGMAQ